MGMGRETHGVNQERNGVLEAMGKVSFKEEVLNSIKCNREVQEDKH